MSRTSAERRLAKGDMANLYAGDMTLGWRVVRQVPMTLGFEKVAKREWRQLEYEDGSLAGFQPVEGCQPEAAAGVFPGWSPVTITVKEMQLYAGRHWTSRAKLRRRIKPY